MSWLFSSRTMRNTVLALAMAVLAVDAADSGEALRYMFNDAAAKPAQLEQQDLLLFKSKTAQYYCAISGLLVRGKHRDENKRMPCSFSPIRSVRRLVTRSLASYRQLNPIRLRRPHLTFRNSARKKKRYQ